MKKILLMLVTWSLLASAMHAQSNNLPSSVIRSTQEGDSRALAQGFNDNIEIILPNKSGVVYSKSQAEYIMGDFFRQNPPTSFAIIHQGQRENSSFAIGKYGSSNGAFRFSFLTKSEGGAILIIQIRIEKENE